VEPVRIGIMGCGDVANFGHAPAINAVGETQLVSVYDPDAGRAADFARRHSVPQWFADVDAFLDSGLETVSVCSPAGAHLGNVVACADRRLPILCEKPIAGSVPDAEKIFRQLLEIYFLGLTRPLPFFPASSFAFATPPERGRPNGAR
jgi:predicted dehydrogenase